MFCCFSFQYSALSLSLPQNIHLLTFEPWKEKSILIRFEHILSIGEDAEYSKPVTFNFEDIFRDLGVTSLRETTLAANQWLSEAVRLNFTSKTEEFDGELTAIETEENEINNLKQTEPKISNFDIHPDISERQYRKSTYKNSYRNIDNDNVILKITLQPMQIRTFIVEV